MQRLPTYPKESPIASSDDKTSELDIKYELHVLENSTHDDNDVNNEVDIKYKLHVLETSTRDDGDLVNVTKQNKGMDVSVDVVIELLNSKEIKKHDS